MKKTNRDIFTVMELNGAAVKASSLELFTAARTITEKTGGQVIAVIIGHNTDEAAKTVSACAPDAIIRVDDERFAEYKTATFTNVLASLVKKYSPDAVMVSATKNGKDLAPRLARRLATGITANCTELSVEPESGLISWNMPAPGGIMATILCSDTRPQMGTICPGAFRKADSVPGTKVEVIDEVADTFEYDGVKLVRRILNETDPELSITDADIIVAGGRGMGSAENFDLVRKLAKLLGAAVGASRVVVDAEWAEQKNLIGQTGKIVRPKLYIACGISGALQHVVGVEKAECIVAINRDPSAPVFKYADYAIIGDAVKILTSLIEQLEKDA